MDGDLIPIVQREISPGQMIDVFSARKLWSGLGIAKDFTDWIKNQIRRCKYVEGKDFWVADILPLSGGKIEKAGRGRPNVDYWLTAYAAEHISMLCETDRGWEYRDWFRSLRDKYVELKKSQPTDLMSLLNDTAHLRALILGFADQKEKLEANVVKLETVVSEQQPKVAGFNLIADAEGSVCLMEAGKLLQWKPYKFIEWLDQHKWIFRSGGWGEWRAYADKIHSGMMKSKVKAVKHSDGQMRDHFQPMITAKGITHLAKMFAKKTGELPFEDEH